MVSRRAMRAPVLLCVVFAAGCATPSQRLHAAVENWFEEDLRLNPLKATYIGDHRYDGDFGNPASPEYETQTRASWEASLAEVEAVDPDALSADDRLTRDVFVHNAEVALEGLRYPERLLPLNQMSSPMLEL